MASAQLLHSISGIIRASDNVTRVQGVVVVALGESDPFPIKSTPSGAMGDYNVFNLPADYYDLFLERTNSGVPLSIAAPGLFNFRVENDLPVSTNLTDKNYNLLPFVSVTGMTRSNMTPVGSVVVGAVATGANAFTCRDSVLSADVPPPDEGDLQGGTREDPPVGSYGLTLIPGTYNFMAQYPDSTVLTRDGVVITGNTVLNFDTGNIPSVIGDQKIKYESTGGSYYFLYNYNEGTYADGNESAGPVTINYSLPFAQWIGAFLYDYADGAWQQGIYALTESLY